MRKLVNLIARSCVRRLVGNRAIVVKIDGLDIYNVQVAHLVEIMATGNQDTVLHLTGVKPTSLSSNCGPLAGQ